MAVRLKTNYLKNVLVAGVALSALVTMPVAAQPAQGGGQGQGMAQQKANPELRQAQQKVRDLRQELGNLQEKTLKNNPELKQQRDDLQAMMEKKVKGRVENADQKMERLKELRQKLQGNKDMPKEKRQKMMQEFQQTAQGFQKAQQQAMQDPEIQGNRKQFQQDLRAAMKQEDPQAEQLIQDLEQAQKEFQTKLQDRFKGQGSQQQGGGQSMPRQQ
ncbi:hypothetical protein [Thiohalorhabdus sp.]|uniref:hypothetical protein n=1 Tax=Thiohalorhabdus sp. TaxID=3094134 RepID=UPI002FC343D9